MRPPRRTDSGAAVVDFVLVMIVLVPLVLAIMQIGLVLHVRNTLTTAASDGARAAAVEGAMPADGARRARHMITEAVGHSYAQDVSARFTRSGGVPTVTVDVEAGVPALGLIGSVVRVHVSGRAIRQTS